ncbi:MinD/ParA family ATP-binding protein [Nocardia brasiliensis]|uniref:MinD/ParA family ATP-binding protein n=1 Tax=Nocardia brasiliensis TaxID=37326 RepID=UPI00245530F7|nr:MinD/ParA family protein [Nocardia brasiliensis]
MSRPTTNGHAVESASPRTGYDAYFSAQENGDNAGREISVPPSGYSHETGSPVIGRAEPKEATEAAAESAVPVATNSSNAPATPPIPQSSPAEQWRAANPVESANPVVRHEVARSKAPIWVPDHGDDRSSGVEVLPAALTSMDLLAEITAANRAKLKSSAGVRGALNKVGFNLGLSPAEQRTEERLARIRRQLTTTYQIAVVSVKGGVGRTTVTAALASTFAALRPDRVIAIDANPDFGDLPTRTAPHPYGLTLRDLVQSSNLEAFSAVQFFASVNSADLATIASPWTTEANETLTGPEYRAAVEILRRHYNLMIADCGTGLMDSATGAALLTSSAMVVVTPATVGGVKGAVATLNWLNSHGMHHLVAASVVAIVQLQRAKPVVEVDAIEKLFATAQRPTYVLPYDPHLAEGGEVDLRLLDKDTLLAFEELAAGLADGFPAYLAGSGERGGWA